MKCNRFLCNGELIFIQSVTKWGKPYHRYQCKKCNAFIDLEVTENVANAVEEEGLFGFLRNKKAAENAQENDKKKKKGGFF